MLQSPSFSTIHAWKCSYQTAVSDAGSHEWQCLHSGCWLQYFVTPSTVSDTLIENKWLPIDPMLPVWAIIVGLNAPECSVANRTMLGVCMQDPGLYQCPEFPYVGALKYTSAVLLLCVSSTLDYNNRKTLIIIITNTNYYYYYKNNNNNDHFIHSHFTEVKIKQVSAQCWAVVWVPQG